MTPSIIAIGIVGLVIGMIGAFGFLKTMGKKQAEEVLKNAEKEGENIKEQKNLRAKEKFLSLKSEHDKKINERNKVMQEKEIKFKQKENTLSQGLENLKKKDSDYKKQKDKLDRNLEVLNAKETEINSMHKRQVEQLETISGLSADEAKAQLVDALQAEAKTEAMVHIQDVVEEAKINATKEARKIVIQTIQRTAAETAIENAVSVFHIESDEIKGRIIGREGRNIRAIEAATGVEVIVDDTPEAIILSCFDPIRREIARLSLHQLVTDGRIHPAKIEETVAKTKKNLEEEIIETGKRTAIDLGIHGLHPELIRMVGRMKYRSSYGQNLLQHSREVANLCATMASELGLDPKMAKRAGLLHDIGKVPEDEPELPHAILGMNIAKKYKENAEICNAIGAHHDEIEMTTMIAPIIQVCDAISGARPGARREILESYIKRIKELEGLALSHPGVIKTYAIQAGRELRVVVDTEKVDDVEAAKISFDISQKIQNEMTYPGQVKVIVIRETRSVSYAK